MASSLALLCRIHPFFIKLQYSVIGYYIQSEPKTLPGGVVIEDKTVGSGSAAKSGKKIGMRYIGRLKNGKVFDSNTKGKPFFFTLGKGEVIKGWDEGIQGMLVGGERVLTIPAAKGYGKRGAPPDIPPNAELTFEVKLVEVK
ncbi:peptidylprolyl isomerase [Rhizoctonia solani AG-1 IB]|uniref:peptidylprolyl isomerase n=1 Tax=Thanatephorus cucumeris (strain AG1-IB / isolate 7/3/14) TaxID=1108050 RepID=M5C0R7_THACB|nr:peptidylprolyl isomerase [Rhizoctonia solani AG-1 IB]